MPSEGVDHEHEHARPDGPFRGHGRDDVATARDETPAERSDRNWAELLQELRVMQTGVQVLTGFLLTLPFQARFAELDTYQVDVYLVLVMLSVVATGLLIAPVSVHRALFGRGLKHSLVTTANRVAITALGLVALLVTGTAMLAFDVVVSRTAGLVVGGVVLVVLTVLWLLVPWRLIRRASSPANS